MINAESEESAGHTIQQSQWCPRGTPAYQSRSRSGPSGASAILLPPHLAGSRTDCGPNQSLGKKVKSIFYSEINASTSNPECLHGHFSWKSPYDLPLVLCHVQSWHNSPHNPHIIQPSQYALVICPRGFYFLKSERKKYNMAVGNLNLACGIGFIFPRITIIGLSTNITWCQNQRTKVSAFANSVKSQEGDDLIMGWHCCKQTKSHAGALPQKKSCHRMVYAETFNNLMTLGNNSRFIYPLIIRSCNHWSESNSFARTRGTGVDVREGAQGAQVLRCPCPINGSQKLPIFKNGTNSRAEIDPPKKNQKAFYEHHFWEK